MKLYDLFSHHPVAGLVFSAVFVFAAFVLVRHTVAALVNVAAAARTRRLWAARLADRFENPAHFYADH